MNPPPRPLVVRYAWPIMLGPALLIGWLVGQFTDYGTVPLIVAAVIFTVCANYVGRVWEKHCARHGHRQDL